MISGPLAPSQLADALLRGLLPATPTTARPGDSRPTATRRWPRSSTRSSGPTIPSTAASVIDAYFATSDRESVLGGYSIDEAGDTELDRVGAYIVRGDGTLRATRDPLGVP